jgi:beta-mannanase
MRDYTLINRVDMLFDYYEEKLGKKPAFYALCCAIPFNLFPAERATMIAEQGAIPNILPEYNGYTLEEFANGAADQAFKDIASEAVQFGQQYGGFFYSPMREINIGWSSWGKQPTQAKKAWQHVWQIFEDTGANEYTTWVWGIKCSSDGSADHPEPYYPGDKYVDWIGLSAYSRAASQTTSSMSFNELTIHTYNEMHSNHPDKPIMQAEFGKTQGRSQPHWLKNAYKTIKSRPGTKAALYWDYPDTWITPNDNLYLSEGSMAVLKEILKDPYWITAK